MSMELGSDDSGFCHLMELSYSWTILKQGP